MTSAPEEMPPVNPRAEARKSKILRAAQKVFAQKGFYEATISDVAKEAGISDATIYEYFSSKEDLLFSIPGETARDALRNMKYILAHIMDTPNKVHAIIYSYLNFYKENPDYAAIAMLILKQNKKFLDTEYYSDVRELARLVFEVIKQGIQNGELRGDIDPFIVRSMILGAIEHLIIRWLLLGKPEDPVSYSKPIADTILKGILTK
jgi:AcrR family transcriptional regulator